MGSGEVDAELHAAGAKVRGGGPAWTADPLHLGLGSHSVVRVTAAALALGGRRNPPDTFASADSLFHYRIRLDVIRT